MQTDAPAVRVSGLEFTWTSRKDAFRLNLDEFQLERQESVLLLGPSGCGKSTLLGLICGTLAARKGEVSVLGQNYSKLSASAIDKFRADHIGVIFQQFNLLPYLSALDNVLLPLRFSRARMNKVTIQGSSAKTEATKLLSALGIDAEHLARQKAATLSVGQQQRVAAARAFIGSPELIVADEPTSALDEDKQEDFLKLLFEQQQKSGAALLMVSHNSRIASHFDRIIHLNKLSKTPVAEAL